MSEHSHSHSQPQPEVSFVDKHYFLIRRLHSLSGLVPIGAYLVIHLLTNAQILSTSDGAGVEFQKAVDKIHSLGPLLFPVEILFIFLPLAFHTLVGFQIALTSRMNAQQYRFGGNVRYTLQRLTGYIAFFFIAYHVWQLHWFGEPLGGGNFKPEDAANSAARAIQSHAWVAPAYAIGVLASVFHLANGIWTALITWGITISPAAQKRSGYVCAVFGVLIGMVGLGALSGFKTFDTADASKHEMSSSHANGSLEHP